MRASIRPRLPVAVLLLCFAFGVWAPALAATTSPSSTEKALEQPAAATLQEGEHAVDEQLAAEEHEVEAKAWWYWPSKWINFIALCALLYWMLVIPPQAVQDIFTYPGLRVIFAERSVAILAARALAAEQKEEAATTLVASEQRLARIEDEVAALVAEAERDAERESERADVEGKQQAEKILEVAQREVRSQRVAAHRQLRGFVADLAVSMAETSLEKHLTADDQDRLIREYLSRLGPSMA